DRGEKRPRGPSECRDDERDRRENPTPGKPEPLRLGPPRAHHPLRGDRQAGAVSKNAVQSAPAERPLPRMNSSTMSCAASSENCTGGDFMKYALGPISGPETPRSIASRAQRIASITMPAEFGESQTSSFSSMLSGTSPNA